MKKKIIALFLVLTMLFGMAAAESAYMPGKDLGTALKDAWTKKHMVTLSLHPTVTVDENLQGLDKESRELLQGILSGLHVTIGAGNTEEGIRLSLEAAYLPPDQKTMISLDGTVTLGTEGLSLESSLLPNQKLTLSLDALMKKLGLTEEDVASVIKGLQGDTEALKDVVSKYLPGMLGAAQQQQQAQEEEKAAVEILKRIEPYGAIIAGWLGQLNTVRGAEAKREGAPDSAIAMKISISGADLAELGSALLAQLETEKDIGSTVEGLLSTLIRSTDPEAKVPSWSELIAMLRSSLDNVKNNEEAKKPFSFYIGVGTTGIHVIGADPADRDVFSAGLTGDAAQGSFTLNMTQNLTEEAQLSETGNLTIDPADKTHFNGELKVAAKNKDTEIFTLDTKVAHGPVTDGTVVIGYDGEASVDMAVKDEQGNGTLNLNVAGSTQVRRSETGESLKADLTVSVPQAELTVTVGTECEYAKVSDLLTGTGKASVTVPGLGQLALNYELAESEYIPGAAGEKQVMDLLQLDEAGMASITDNLMNSLQLLVMQLMFSMME